MLEVLLLGPLQVLGDDGVDLTPAGGRERQCLAVLATVGAEGVSMDRLTRELYGDRSPNEPRNAIQAVISRLRRSLGAHAEAIETTGTGYRLVGAVTDVEPVLTDLRRAADASDPVEAQAALDHIMSRWRGRPYEGLDGELIDAQRNRIENQRLKAEELILERRLSGQPARGIDQLLLDDLETAVGSHPLRENRWRLLMLALYRDGQPAAALRAFQRARSIMVDELGLEPGPTLTELEQRILAHDPELLSTTGGGEPATRTRPLRPASSPALLLPRLRSNLFGRGGLVADVEAEVGRRPLVTLLGPGGIGKTTLAVAAAWRLVNQRPVHFVDLASITDPDQVASRVAEQLGMPDGAATEPPAAWVGTHLVANPHVVLIDNAEHVVTGVADLVDGILRHHDVSGSFLITSRRPLQVPGETVIAVPPLVADNGAVQLFCDRVKAVQPNLEIDDAQRAVAAAICDRLDGIPLAIELAAGRATVLSIDDIAARLDDQLRLLRQPLSTGEPRHESLEAVVTWSVDLLSPTGPPAVRAPGRHGRRRSRSTGAEAVAANCGLEPDTVLDGLDELVRASLLVAEGRGGRLRMLEPIRQAALARLSEQGLEGQTRRAHARWSADLLADAHSRRDHTRGEAMGRTRDRPSERRRGLAGRDRRRDRARITDLALPAGWWYLSHDVRQGGRLLGRLLARLDRDRHDELAWALTVMGLAVATATDPRSEVAAPSLDAITILDRHGHPDAGVCRVAAALAQTEFSDIEVPVRLLAEAERLVSSDDQWATAVVDLVVMAVESLLHNLGRGTIDTDSLLAKGERAAAVFAAMEEQWALGVTLTELGRVYQRLGDIEEAEARFLQGLEQLSDEHDYHGRHYVFTELGRLASARGEHERAVELHDRAEEIAAGDGNPGCMAMVLAGKADAAEARGDRVAAIEHYTRALDLMDLESLIETGADEWRRALDRLTATDA